jgi:hypothetical protein
MLVRVRMMRILIIALATITVLFTLSHQYYNNIEIESTTVIQDTPHTLKLINNRDKDGYFTTIIKYPMRDSSVPTKLLTVSTSTVDISNIPSSNSGVHWCIISKKESSRTARKYFNHFPHAAESLLPCWSWWRRSYSEKKCGLILLDNLTLPHGSWQDQLVNKVLSCRVQHFCSEDKEVNMTHPLGESGIYHTIPLHWKLPRTGRINYMDRPQDAW